MNNINYYQKYSKYKQKYINKSMSGGGGVYIDFESITSKEITDLISSLTKLLSKKLESKKLESEKLESEKAKSNDWTYKHFRIANLNEDDIYKMSLIYKVSTDNLNKKIQEVLDNNNTTTLISNTNNETFLEQNVIEKSARNFLYFIKKRMKQGVNITEKPKRINIGNESSYEVIIENVKLKVHEYISDNKDDSLKINIKQEAEKKIPIQEIKDDSLKINIKQEAEKKKIPIQYIKEEQKSISNKRYDSFKIDDLNDEVFNIIMTECEMTEKQLIDTIITFLNGDNKEFMFHMNETVAPGLALGVPTKINYYIKKYDNFIYFIKYIEDPSDNSGHQTYAYIGLPKGYKVEKINNII